MRPCWWQINVREYFLMVVKKVQIVGPKKLIPVYTFLKHSYHSRAIR